MNDLYVYIHIPFCEKKCIYCDFLSVAVKSLEEEYFQSLIKDIESSEILKNSAVKTVYFGGGTPSYVDERYIDIVLNTVAKTSRVFDPEEITIELNPESTDGRKIKFYRFIGVNRASLGVQAMDDEVLEASGRIHDAAQAEKAAFLLREVFDNLNLDFIIGLPGSSMEAVEQNLKLIEKVKPDHVSVYMLEIHEETPLFSLLKKGRIHLPSDDDMASMFDEMMEGLTESGFERYEISNFAKDGKRSLHNLSYWLNKNYIGFGASAGGHVGNYRYVKTMSVQQYIDNPFSLSYERHNTDCEEFKETLFMGLRLVDGISIESLKKRFPELLKDFLVYVSEDSLFSIKDDRIKLSKAGLDLSKLAFEKIVRWNCE
ncbi:MAG: radical SAM family heme chaperone HemW [Thermotogaceae bacterium]|nr:radical SAM family heme chaperone HemW [Thermotogaceae bacterium]